MRHNDVHGELTSSSYAYFVWKPALSPIDLEVSLQHRRPSPLRGSRHPS